MHAARERHNTALKIGQMVDLCQIEGLCIIQSTRMSHLAFAFGQNLPMCDIPPKHHDFA